MLTCVLPVWLQSWALMCDRSYISHRALVTQQVPLPAAVLSKGDTTGLLFGASTAQLAEAHSESALYCAHGATWSVLSQRHVFDQC